MKPILFSTPMVQAILAGGKTQTRRVIKPQPDENGVGFMPNAPLDFHGDWKPWKWDTEDGERISKDSNYQRGDILYVRETFTPYMTDEGEWRFAYKAEKDGQDIVDILEDSTWKPSIFMPKEAARIFLQVTDVRAERLQDISEADAIAEGAKDVLTFDEMKVMKGSKFVIPRPFLMHQFGFMSIWCKINGVESWDSNPWVWVYTFKKIQNPNL